jgi:hypothetical protein
MLVGLETPERLAGLQVMRRVPGELEQRPAGPALLGLPRMPLRLSLSDRTHEPVMADVVDVLEQEDRERGLSHERRRDPAPPADDEPPDEP